MFAGNAFFQKLNDKMYNNPINRFLVVGAVVFFYAVAALNIFLPTYYPSSVSQDTPPPVSVPEPTGSLDVGS